MSRKLSCLLGVLVLLAVWSAPIGRLVPGSFSAHMAMHMGVVGVAAPLVAYGVAGGSFDFVRRAPRLFPPIPISILELLVVWLWHAPVLHHAARESRLSFVVEQGSFLAAGLGVWLSAFGGTAVERHDRGAAGVVALLLTSMHMTLLGALLALSPRPLYAHGYAEDTATFSPLQDQHWGGAIMLVGGGVSYLLGGLFLTAELLRRRHSPPTVPSARRSLRSVGSRGEA